MAMTIACQNLNCDMCLNVGGVCGHGCHKFGEYRDPEGRAAWIAKQRAKRAKKGASR